MIGAGIAAAMKVSLKALEEINDYVYIDENIFCHWNKPLVRKS